MYWILLIFLCVGLFYPVIGFIAILCMVAPVGLAIYKGRHWCGNFCPRGNFYDQVLSRISPQKPIPAFLRKSSFRKFMVAFIFTVFGVQMYFAWGDLSAMGAVFVNIILITTIVGIVLGLRYHQRSWCSFCPMGTMSSWVTPKPKKRSKKLDKKLFKTIMVDDSCIGCKLCTKVCPMQLKPYEEKGNPDGFMHSDCLKCGKCIKKCPKKALKFEKVLP